MKKTGDMDLREYIGYIWIDNEPGKRLSVFASSSNEAGQKVEAEYGKGHVFSIWNEEDSQKPR